MATAAVVVVAADEAFCAVAGIGRRMGVGAGLDADAGAAATVDAEAGATAGAAEAAFNAESAWLASE